MAGLRGSSESVLACHGLAYQVNDQTVLTGVTFEIRPGQALGVLGGPAAGKTTLVRNVCGMLRPISGRVLLHGRQVDTLPAETVAAAVGYVPHSVGAVGSMTVAETVRFWGRLAGLPRAAAYDRANEVLTRLGLADRADQLFVSCPMWVQRELSLAVALLQRPALLVLDEPCRGADVSTSRRILAALRGLRDEGVALLYASRDADQLRQVCDQVSVLRQGRLVPQCDLDREQRDLDREVAVA